ncbi:ATP-dependent nuclease [Vibrio aestuarianus]|uniref:ATPase/GTPase, AAA15 family n=1 Tax=Vibrio aestuarianus TaxID=28171 RepID=A0ABN8TMA4_9VIBR|nr:ATP-binding protein [Vibrio aestuarianus]MDE1211932.1 ATP-binding protein [Vibrio aestuarianus]MDE1229190.1 ATP-binding protein [Vibrio aestuarianus]MDE1255257.1 ATP-binding protein [Vibrio aestuarianus]MDE1273355.1 ATP-binding protein [Vibrio aestuarianus]MDE1308883.1 ATP-binding protein [Vibrio aestuarianus]
MINNISFLFGSDSVSDSLLLAPKSVNIFVGPNNSGKSLILKEIESICNNPEPNRKIIAGIDIQKIDKDDFIRMVKAREIDKPEGYSHQDGSIFMRGVSVFSDNDAPIRQVSVDYLIEQIEGTQSNFNYLAENFLSYYTVRLDGKTRFSLTEPRASGDLTKEPKNHLMALFQNDDARKRISDITFDAIGKYFVIDPTSMTQFKVRMSDVAPKDNSEEQGLDQTARDFHSNATDIENMSDGVKAFTGLVSSTLSQDYKVVLIDEPEAFLHPPLARKLGKVLSSLAKEKDQKMFIATHSSDFVMGCVQSGQKINIVRMTYTNGVPSARHLPSEKLSELMKNPLLRSSGVLGAMFHESVIVSESDADRAFYQEVNERLNQFGGDGAKDSLFINAQNKQTIGRIVAPLREMGIPAAAIADLDIIKVNKEFKEICKACNIPQELIDSWGVLRGNITNAFSDSGLNPNKNGILELPKKHQDSVQMLIENLAKFGLFVVPVGALEQWLRCLEITDGRHGPQWIMEAFAKMGEDPEDEGYLMPSEGDVWQFIRNVSMWVSDPYRKGV